MADKQAVADTVVHIRRQLNAALAVQNHKPEQADILFLRVPHRADQRMECGIQHRPLGAAQYGNIVPARHGGRLQKCGSLGIQPVIQCAHLAAEPGNAALRCRVCVLQRGDSLVPDAVTGVGVLGVGFILHIVLPQRGAVGLGVGAGQAEARAHIAAAARRNTRKTMQPCSPRYTEEHRLGLIGHGVGRGNDGLLAGGQLIKPTVPQAACPVLAGVGRHVYPLLHGIVQEKLHAVPAAEIRHKVSIAAGGLAPDSMVHVGGQHLNGQFAAVTQQKKQQSH